MKSVTHLVGGPVFDVTRTNDQAPDLLKKTRREAKTRRSVAELLRLSYLNRLAGSGDRNRVSAGLGTAFGLENSTIGSGSIIAQEKGLKKFISLGQNTSRDSQQL